VSYISTNPGRFAYAILRIACDLNLEDYVAHRLILGLPSGIGIGTCNAIRKLVIDNNLNYLNLFYQPLPANIFKGRTLTAINRARTLCEQLRSWKAEDTLISHSEEIAQLVGAAFNQAAAQVWKDTTAHLPADINLKELQTYLSADTDEQQAKVLESVYQRLELEPPQSGFLPPNVRIMTMHGVKGLDAQVVFIPALEAEILPNPKHRPYPGLVLEAARLLYVSITRARAACVMSYATNRFANGRFEQRTPCSFLPSLQGRFDFRDGGLTAEETSSISQMIEIICELN
jgi:superfamily I DNA/RNA helicase